jgi:hypothetical protein
MSRTGSRGDRDCWFLDLDRVCRWLELRGVSRLELGRSDGTSSSMTSAWSSMPGSCWRSRWGGGWGSRRASTGRSGAGPCEAGGRRDGQGAAGDRHRQLRRRGPRARQAGRWQRAHWQARLPPACWPPRGYQRGPARPPPEVGRKWDPEWSSSSRSVVIERFSARLGLPSCGSRGPSMCEHRFRRGRCDAQTVPAARSVPPTGRSGWSPAGRRRSTRGQQRRSRAGHDDREQGPGRQCRPVVFR